MDTKEELKEEHKCRTDYDYALEKLNISNDMTIEELAYAVKTLNEWGWDMTICDAIEELL